MPLIANAMNTLYLIRKNLQQPRDRLLTRFISGKFSVEELDIQIPACMTEELEAKHDK
jgi:hypothetical protein